MAGVVGLRFVWVSARVVGVVGALSEFGRLCICRKGERVSNHFERSGSAFYIKFNFKQKLVFCVSAFNQFILAMRRVEHCDSA